MTQASKLKQKVRKRSARTGESYAAARKHVLAEVERKRQARSTEAAKKARASTAKGTVSEAKCIEKTGHGFDYWFGVLDRFKSPAKGHKASARYLQDEHGVSAWYAQALTVSYERVRGIRTLNQTCAGDFQVSVSRVLPTSTQRATAALSQKADRSRWLPATPLAKELEEALSSKRFRRTDEANTFGYRTADARVDLRITTKPDGRSTVWVQASQLGSAAAVEKQRTRWRSTLDALRAHLRAT